MARRKTIQVDPFVSSPEAVALLKQSAWTFDVDVMDEQVYELRLQLATPGVFTPAKADILVPGLPTLDGFLSFLAFRAALATAMTNRPDMATELVWQWNAALRDHTFWIHFPLPLKQTNLEEIEIFDCSIGLPVEEDDILIPAGAFFVQGLNFETYPKIIDSIPLRRRVAEPYHRPLALLRNLETGAGPTKLLDNRMYFALTQEYRFYFRGNAQGVERLLTFAREQRIGMGKKTTLGYGQIKEFKLSHSTANATLIQQVPHRPEYSLVKTLPYSIVMAQRLESNALLFGCSKFKVTNPLETWGAYKPPYWIRNHQTQVLTYGTLLLPSQ